MDTKVCAEDVEVATWEMEVAAPVAAALKDVVAVLELEVTAAASVTVLVATTVDEACDVVVLDAWTCDL